MKNFFLKMPFIFLLIFNFLPINSFLPETIATISLLKYGGAISVAALGGHFIKKDIFKGLNISCKPYPRVNPYDSFEHIPQAHMNPVVADAVRNEVIKKEEKFNLLGKIKSKFFIKKEQNFYQKNEFFQENRSNLKQSYVHAQQAYGFFPKINNNYYYKQGNEEFWKGLALGSFFTGNSSLFLVLMLQKKDKN